jgi:hypothetical protein
MIIMLQNPILKVDLSFFFNAFNGNLKNTYALSNYACYDHNILDSQCEVGLNTVLTSHFQMYF